MPLDVECPMEIGHPSSPRQRTHEPPEHLTFIEACSYIVDTQLRSPSISDAADVKDQLKKKFQQLGLKILRSTPNEVPLRSVRSLRNLHAGPIQKHPIIEPTSSYKSYTISQDMTTGIKCRNKDILSRLRPINPRGPSYVSIRELWTDQDQPMRICVRTGICIDHLSIGSRL